MCGFTVPAIRRSHTRRARTLFSVCGNENGIAGFFLDLSVIATRLRLTFVRTSGAMHIDHGFLSIVSDSHLGLEAQTGGCD